MLEDYESFVFKQLPNILRRRVNNNYQGRWSKTAAMTGHNLAGGSAKGVPESPREGLKVLITLHGAGAPAGWSTSAKTPGAPRPNSWPMWPEELERKKRRLGNLEGRLLKIVLAGVAHRDLESRAARNRTMYSIRQPMGSGQQKSRISSTPPKRSSPKTELRGRRGPTSPSTCTTGSTSSAARWTCCSTPTAARSSTKAASRN